MEGWTIGEHDVIGIAEVKSLCSEQAERDTLDVVAHVLRVEGLSSQF